MIAVLMLPSVVLTHLKGAQLQGNRMKAGSCGLSDQGLALRPVEDQGFRAGVDVLEAWDGTLRVDRRPMGEDGTALPRQAG